MFSKPRGKTRYQENWIAEFPWVRPVQGNIYSARCNLCSSEFAVDSMGRRALQSHAQGKKHSSRSNSKSLPMSIFVKKISTEAIPQNRSAAQASVSSLGNENPITPSVDPSCSLPSTSQQAHSSSLPPSTSQQAHSSSLPPSISQQAHSSSACAAPFPTCTDIINQEPPKKKIKILDSFVAKENITKAEIIWCMLAVTTHMSLRTAGLATSLFKLMFPTDSIAQGIQLQKSKISYIIVHGLGPYFYRALTRKLNNCNFVVVGFDESLNKIAQQQQMDINIRFWDQDIGQVKTQYLQSVFLECATAEDLLTALKSGLADVDLKKIIQISMDGPNVNFKMLRLLKEGLAKEPDEPELLDIGSCGLHTIHCAFKNGIKATGWLVVPFLRAIYNLFKNVPSRRGDFKRITGTDIFPSKFCAVRWTENVNVAERAQKILPHIQKYVDEVKRTKKEPKCSSFKVVESSLSCKLLLAQLAFFQSVAERITPFLTEYQSDAPLAPFLHTSLATTTKTIVEAVVKNEILESTPIYKIDLTKKENLKEAKYIELGFGTKKALGKSAGLQIKDKEIMQFREEAKSCLVTLAKKILERSPLKFELTKALTCLDPKVVLTKGAGNEFKSALKILVEKNHISGSCADRISTKFKDLISRADVVDSLKCYSRSERLDTFWMSLIKKCDTDYKELASFVQILLVISHGNANLERGFSINKECLVPNQQEKSLIAQRHVIEAVNMAGGVDKIEITKDIIHAARNSRAKYQESLELQKQKDDAKRVAAEEKKKASLLVKELQREKRIILEETERKISTIQEKIKDLSK